VRLQVLPPQAIGIGNFVKAKSENDQNILATSIRRIDPPCGAQSNG
jgi:hypothetical protein